MRILLLTLYYAPDVAANAVIMTELAEQLAALGHQVQVVTAFPHYAHSRIDDAYRGRLFQREQREGVRITRTYLYASGDKSNLPARLAGYLSFSGLATLAGVLCKGYDLILAPSPPLTLGVNAWLLGGLRRVPFVYNVQDIYPDIAIRLGILKNVRAIRVFQWMERFVYRKAAAVTVLSEGFRRNLLAKGVTPAKVQIIPNFVDTDFVHPLPRQNEFSHRQGLDDRFVVLYAGNVGLSQGLETLLDAAALLQDIPELCVLINGNGAAKASLEERAEALRLTNVRFLPFQPREELPQVYASADVSVVLLKEGIGAESVPSKAYTILASGRPLLAAVDAGAETRELVASAQCGRCVPPEDPRALADAIRALHAAPGERLAMGERGRAYVVQHHTPKAVAQQYHDFLCALKSSA